MSERQLAVVIPVYNEEALITETMEALYAQSMLKTQRDGTHHFIVDNGSTDTTEQRIGAFINIHDDFPLTLLHEDEKGTGAASDTGFRRAIEEGYEIIARTDGDTCLAADWTARITKHFAQNHSLQLLGGTSLPLQDEFYRPIDDKLFPVGVEFTRAMIALTAMDPIYLKLAIGHNMATRSEAYIAVDGFPRSSIDTMNEDAIYTRRIATGFGRQAIHIDKQLQVRTSTRRGRTYGAIGTMLYYLFPDKRSDEEHAIDVR